MNRDRLNELRGGNSYNNSYSQGGSYSNSYRGGNDNNNYNNYQYNHIDNQQSSYELQPMNNNSGDDGFMAQIQNLEQMIRTGNSNVEKIRKLYSNLLVNVNQSESYRNHQMLEDLRSETSNIYTRVGSSIKKIDMETKRLGRDKSVPIRKAQITKLTKSLKNALQNYTDVQRDFKEKYRERMKRQYRVVNQNATEEEIERALDNPNQQIFQQGLTMSLANSQNALREAKDKHEELKKIEQSITELVTLFQDMETLLMTQSETILNIENNLNQAEDDVNQASKQMSQAIEIRKKSRKTLWIITAIIAAILLIVIILNYANIKAILGDLFGWASDDDDNNNNNNQASDQPQTE